MRVVALLRGINIGPNKRIAMPALRSIVQSLGHRDVETYVQSGNVLEGELTFTAGDRELRAEAGSWVQVPPGVPHTFAFSGDRSVRFLDVHTPSCGFGEGDTVRA